MTQNRLETRFAALKAEGRAALVTFITAGDPDRATSLDILKGLPAAGADVIELGVPFSDPMADGPAIQEANLRALAHDTTLADTIDMVASFRAENTDTPIVLMGYYNPIYRMSAETFCQRAAAAGVDGMIVVDLPPEEDHELRGPAEAHGLRIIRLATPTTRGGRLHDVLDGAGGFLYYVSITGVTGTAKPDTRVVGAAVATIKAETELPVCVGFGINDQQSAQAMAEVADGVVVGSALIRQVTESLDADKQATAATVENVHALVRDLATGVQAASKQAAE